MGTGWDTVDAELENFAAEAKNRQRRTPFNFRLEKGGKAEIVFLTDDVYTRYEHPYFIGGVPGSIPCLAGRELGDCPACLHNLMNPKSPIKGRTLMAYATVILLGETTSSTTGKTYKNPVRAMIMKPTTIEKLKMYREEADNDLTGLKFVIRRSHDDKSPAVGDNWFVKNRYSPEELTALNPEAKPHNWEETLPIMTAGEIAARIQALTGVAPQSAPAASTPESRDGPMDW